MYTASDIPETRFHGTEKTHIYKGTGFERNGIIEKFPEINNPGYTGADQHRFVRRFGIGPALRKRLVPT